MRRSVLSLLFAPLLFCACHERASAPSLPVANAVYYWRTAWRLDEWESAFLSRYGVRRVYCRYFDVVMRDGQPMPNATLRFPDDTPLHVPDSVELVPTVYITADCMSGAPSGGWPLLADRLVRRVVQMNATHDLPPARELQVDCDYTQRSRTAYYDFLSQVRTAALRHGMRLSVTIRLHQLSMPAPPADYGVLMVYNTGDPQRFAERNPILDIRDVRPYVSRLGGYPLPLAAAYPVYRWQRSIGGVRIEHSVEAHEILAAKKMIEGAREDMSHTIIIYCLDRENIARYDRELFDGIFSRRLIPDTVHSCP